MDTFNSLSPKERLTSSSVRIFVFWITLPALLVISIAMIFLKNQTKPIIKLADNDLRNLAEVKKLRNLDHLEP